MEDGGGRKVTCCLALCTARTLWQGDSLMEMMGPWSAVLRLAGGDSTFMDLKMHLNVLDIRHLMFVLQEVYCSLTKRIYFTTEGNFIPDR